MLRELQSSALRYEDASQVVPAFESPSGVGAGYLGEGFKG